MQMRDRNQQCLEVGSRKDTRRAQRARRVAKEDKKVPEIYEVVIECRHEREQRAVFERMRGEGFQCRVLTL